MRLQPITSIMISRDKRKIKCADCSHIKGECDCMCCCPISKMGCPSCIVVVLGYRQVKKLIRKVKEAKGKNEFIPTHDGK